MVTILHTNDLHSALGMLPRLAALIGRERARDPAALLLDAGDLGLGGPTADLGLALLVALRYDALTPGNAENDLLEHRAYLGRLGAPVLAANLAPGALGFPTRPYLLRDAGGLRLAIIGLTTPPVYPAGHPLHRPSAQEVPVGDWLAAARAWVPRVREQAEVVVVLSHLGLRRDIELARAVPGIDLIVGGHSHHRLPAPLAVGTTRIVQAGIRGAYLGVVAVERRGDDLHIAGRLEPIWQPVVADAALGGIIDDYLRRRLPDWLIPVGATEGCWADPWRENAWANAVTDRLREQAGADVCLVNANALQPALDPGPITGWDLARCLPGLGANEAMGLDGVVAMTITGEALRAIGEHSVGSLAWDLADGVPSSFCWPGNTLLHAAGLRLTADLTRPAGQRVVDLLVGGRPVEPDRRYSIATSGFLAKGYSGYHWLRDGADRRVVGRERDLLDAALRAGRPLPPLDERLTLLPT